MIKRIITFVLALTLIVTIWVGSGISSQAGCSSWTVVSSSTECDYSDRCGIFWINAGTQYVTGTKERYCEKDGKQERETTYYCNKDGCCN